MNILYPILLLVTSANCQRLSRAGVEEGGEPAPEPYAFAFSSATEDGGASTREESQDASGRVVGFYTIDLPDGSKRRVDYEADANGYRARISTNEIGTENRNPADVEMESSAPSVEELVARYGSSYATASRTSSSSGAAGVGLNIGSSGGSVGTTTTRRVTGGGTAGVRVITGGGGSSRTETVTTTRRVTGGGSAGTVLVRPSPPTTATTTTTTTRRGEDGIEYVVVPVRRGSTLREAVNELGLPSEQSEAIVLSKNEAQQLMSKYKKF